MVCERLLCMIVCVWSWFNHHCKYIIIIYIQFSLHIYVRICAWNHGIRSMSTVNIRIMNIDSVCIELEPLQVISQQFIKIHRKERQQPSWMHCIVMCPVSTCLSFVDTVPQSNHVARSYAKFCFPVSCCPKPTRQITISHVLSSFKKNVSP